MINLPQIPIYKFNFQLEALEDMRLPQYKGSMFRGAFGTAFRKSVCVTKYKTCENCLLQSQCSYFQIFETEIPDNNLKILKGVKKHPHPFVLHPHPDSKRIFKKGENFELGLTIFGAFIYQFPFFLFTIIQMGKMGISNRRSKFEVLNAANIYSGNTQVIVYKNSTGKLKNNYQPLSIEKELDGLTDKNSDIKITFKTPFRVQNLSQIIYDARELTFEVFFRTVVRRIMLLSALFCNNDFDYYIQTKLNNAIKENNLRLFEWQRYSNRQKEKIEMNGFVGSITFANVAPEYIKLIKLASFMNIGKNTVFGLGEFDLEIL
jgi:hypothetical protein